MKVLRITALMIVLDQATKFIIKGFAIPFLGIHVAGMFPGESHELIGNFLRLTFVENPGMAFGVNFGEPTKIFFSLFSLVASGAILWYLYSMRSGPLPVRIALALILAGAFGNFIDRTFYGIFYGSAPLFHGSVVDFIDVDFFKMNIGRFHLDRWPVFNIADSCVSVGVTLFILTAQRHTHHSGEQVISAPTSTPTTDGDQSVPTSRPVPRTSLLNNIIAGDAV